MLPLGIGLADHFQILNAVLVNVGIREQRLLVTKVHSVAL